MHADETARQKIEVEKVRAELQKIATEKEFLENDLAEGTKQIRNLQRTIKKGGENIPESKAAGKENQPVTPKKKKALAYADGFDDEEIQPMSQSRLAVRSKANTPKAGAKRKRRPEASPAKSLDLTPPIQTDMSGEELQHKRSDFPSPSDKPLPLALIQEDQRFKVTVLNALDCQANDCLESLPKSCSTIASHLKNQGHLSASQHFVFHLAESGLSPQFYLIKCPH